jgi:hypothetical protein
MNKGISVGRRVRNAAVWAIIGAFLSAIVILFAVGWSGDKVTMRNENEAVAWAYRRLAELIIHGPIEYSGLDIRKFLPPEVGSYPAFKDTSTPAVPYSVKFKYGEPPYYEIIVDFFEGGSVNVSGGVWK